MLINSDWHIHSEYSYDAHNPLELIAESAREAGLLKIGITDHLNYNDEKFLGDIRSSAKNVKALKEKYTYAVLGVELTPIALPEFEYIARTGTREGYVPPIQGEPYKMELALTKDELMALGIQYAVGGSHWRVDVAPDKACANDLDASIREWYRQQMWLACDVRVTVLAHPWYNGGRIWYEDFSLIPHSMNMDIAAALKENKKYVECNSGFFCPTRNAGPTEKFKHQYAEFLRELFEMGIPVTYGSDSHRNYRDVRETVEEYLVAAGFAEGDISEISDADLWQ